MTWPPPSSNSPMPSTLLSWYLGHSSLACPRAVAWLGHQPGHPSRRDRGSPRVAAAARARADSRAPPSGRLPRVPLPARRRQAAFALAFVAPSVVLFALAPLMPAVGLAARCSLLSSRSPVSPRSRGRPRGSRHRGRFRARGLLLRHALHSLRVDRVIDLVALVAYVAVAGWWVCWSTCSPARPSLGTRSGDRCQSGPPGRQHGGRRAKAIDPLPSTLRRAFDLRAVALLRSAGGRWVVRTRREGRCQTVRGRNVCGGAP